MERRVRSKLPSQCHRSISKTISHRGILRAMRNFTEMHNNTGKRKDTSKTVKQVQARCMHPMIVHLRDSKEGRLGVMGASRKCRVSDTDFECFCSPRSRSITFQTIFKHEPPNGIFREYETIVTFKPKSTK